MTAEATTTYKAFTVPVKGQLRPVCGTKAWARRTKVAGVFVFEEISMTTSTHMVICLGRAMTARGITSLEQLFEDCLVVMVGDVCQLPPVCKHGRRWRRG